MSRRKAGLVLLVATAVLCGAPLLAEDAGKVREEFSKRLGRGMRALRTGDAAGAAEDLCWAARRGLNSHRANLNCGRALLRLREPSKAVRHIRLATELKPRDLGSWVSLGDAYLSAGSLDRARAAFFKALEIRSDHSPAYDGLARLAQNRGDEDAALEAFDKALEANPTDARARLNRGYLHIEKERYEQALEDIREAARLRPDDAEVQLGYARVLLASGLSNQALTAARRAGAILPKDPRVPELLAEVFETLRAYDEAEESARRALALDTHLPRARRVLGAVLAHTGRLDEALTVLTPPEPARLRPRELELLTKESARWEARKAEIASLRSRDGETLPDPGRRILLGQALVETGLIEEGLSEVAAGLAAAPAPLELKRRAAAVYFAAERPLEAATLLETIVAAPNSTTLDRANFAVALELVGETKRAEALYRQALEAPDTPAAVHAGLARLALARGETESVIEHLEAFLASAPTPGEATRVTRALARLRGTPADGEDEEGPTAQPAAHEEKQP